MMSFPQRVEFPISSVIAMVEGVKSRLGDWSTELKSPNFRENMSFKDEEKAIAKNQTFNIQNMTGGFIGDPTTQLFRSRATALS